MRLPLVLATLLYTLGAFGALHPMSDSPAAYDFSATISGPVTVNGQRLEAPVRVANRGRSNFAGNLRFKGFLLPDENHPIDSDLNDGTVLTYTDLAVTIGAGSQTVVRFAADLPPLRKAKYLLGVIVNSNDAVYEENPMDNTSPLVEVGELVVEGHGDPDFDLYSEIAGPFRTVMGGVGHTLRTIVRGDKTFFPSAQYSDRKLWARFYAVDLMKRSIYLLPYDKYNFDKNWYSIVYANEVDAQGKPIAVDYYSEAPRIDLVPPGSYKFLTLMNHRDLIPESNLGNNLDAKPFEIKATEYVAAQSLWFVAAGDEKPSLTFQLTNVYGAQTSWKIVKPVEATWLSLSQMEGAISTSATPTLNATIDAAGLAPGDYATELVATFESQPASPLKIPVHLHVRAPQDSTLELGTPSLTFQAHPWLKPEAKPITFRNTGAAPMKWKIDLNQEWLAVDKTAGTLAAGAMETVKVRVSPATLSPYVYTGKVTLLTTASQNPTEIETKMTITN